ncbi:hypothetical protein DFJ58DRAFT_846703 [Suillus subalutaceus]|uniref:uncharacterized protein n=1 Tax=Suillus subalutaceus TaxID=48586 RepID=UPI001B86404D|nr:uncharacterized protein DFJ58DRAFT_846703 [Suillus subalutaceus]KAG1836956.1 hypothetical protein DFJ58DRAFT_846703 [Suillus subalutaceus]
MYIENYEVHLEDALWMGSAMVIDEPNSPTGRALITSNVPMTVKLWDMCLEEKQLMRSLEKVISKCIERHSLEGALEGIEIDNIMSDGSKGGEKRKSTTANKILFSLGTILREKSETLGLRNKPGSLAGMPGGYPTEMLTT